MWILQNSMIAFVITSQETWWINLILTWHLSVPFMIFTDQDDFPTSSLENPLHWLNLWSLIMLQMVCLGLFESTINLHSWTFPSLLFECPCSTSLPGPTQLAQWLGVTEYLGDAFYYQGSSISTWLLSRKVKPAGFLLETAWMENHWLFCCYHPCSLYQLLCLKNVLVIECSQQPGL